MSHVVRAHRVLVKANGVIMPRATILKLKELTLGVRSNREDICEVLLRELAADPAAQGIAGGSMSTEPIKALSIKQPWADHILFDGKDVENRSWRLPPAMIGQRIQIHAGKRPDGEYRGDPARLGALLGEVTIVGCVTNPPVPVVQWPVRLRAARPRGLRRPGAVQGLPRVLHARSGTDMTDMSDTIHIEYRDPATLRLYEANAKRPSARTGCGPGQSNRAVRVYHARSRRPPGGGDCRPWTPRGRARVGP